VDGTFAFFSNLTFATYYAGTRTEGTDKQTSSYRGQMEYRGDRYGLQLERLAIDPKFNPEVGFLRRDRHPQELRPGAVQSPAEVDPSPSASSPE
jgi:hypothetical protein